MGGRTHFWGGGNFSNFWSNFTWKNRVFLIFYKENEEILLLLIGMTVLRDGKSFPGIFRSLWARFHGENTKKAKKSHFLTFF